MPVNISRLRYWFAFAAIAVVVVVAGFYVYGRIRVARALNEVPRKLGGEIQQSTTGFSYSKSEAGRTLFTIRAEKAVQYKEGGRAALRNVNIVVYGRQSNRFDQIYGADFDYDPQTGDVVSRGEVQIDLEGDTSGSVHPDQVPPQELKNPIHVKTSGLAFNQKTGMARTSERVEFRIPQADGWAKGASYDSKANVLLLDSEVHINTTDPEASTITAQHGTLTRMPRRVILYDARLQRDTGTIEANQVTVFLRDDNSAELALATGNLRIAMRGPTVVQAHAPSGELRMTGRSNDLQTGRLWGGVQMETSGASAMAGSADNVLLDFLAKNKLSKLRAQGKVKLLQTPKAQLASAPKAGPQVGPNLSSPSQAVELAADTVDFYMSPDGDSLQRAETAGAAQVKLVPRTANTPATQGQNQGQTVITAGKFYAGFQQNHMESMRGLPDAKVVSSAPGQPDKVTTSQTLDVKFAPDGGITKIVQQHNFQYHEVQPGKAERAAWAEMASYTPENEQLVLNGSPRVVDGAMTTTARVLRLDRRSGDVVAEGAVKSTYSELKPQPGGALLASSDPIHVTARAMTAQRSPALAHYTGDARLWQGANIVQAPAIDFSRDQRTIVAQGQGTQKVNTVLVQNNAQQANAPSGKQTPFYVTAARLTYTDAERTARFEGGVTMRGADSTATADQAEVFLRPAGSGNSGASQVDRIVAEKNILIQQPNRKATGQKMVYTAAEDKFVLTGGSPSIFDAERGTITGASLTFWNRNDRVLVEGGPSRAVTQTRVSK